jgi:hypothetical protein
MLLSIEYTLIVYLNVKNILSISLNNSFYIRITSL